MTKSTDLLTRDISAYYNSLGSKLGYKFLLNNVRHCGYYENGDYSWQLAKAQRNMEQKLGYLLSLPKGSKVLDAGCGTGVVALFLARNFGLHIKGVDLLSNNINEAEKSALKSGFLDKLEFQVGDYTNLTYDNNSFDGIYTMETLVHAADAEAVLKKFYKALKPGGRIVMHEYFHAPHSKMPPKVRKALSEVNRAVGMPSMELFEKRTLSRMVEEAGFKKVKLLDISQQVKPMWKIFYILMIMPYILGSLLRIKKHMTNSLGSVMVYRNQKYFGYAIVSATKP